MARILVIDDERDVVDLVKFILQHDGHDIIEAYDGEEGLQRAINDHPDLIILDLRMPNMDGYAVNSNLLKNDTTRNIPVIILTVKGRIQDTFEMTPNVKAFIEKPFDPAKLHDKVAEGLQIKS